MERLKEVRAARGPGIATGHNMMWLVVQEEHRNEVGGRRRKNLFMSKSSRISLGGSI